MTHCKEPLDGLVPFSIPPCDVPPHPWNKCSYCQRSQVLLLANWCSEAHIISILLSKQVQSEKGAGITMDVN
jgi:hypothetical protein